jgi:hypothetical protein
MHQDSLFKNTPIQHNPQNIDTNKREKTTLSSNSVSARTWVDPHARLLGGCRVIVVRARLGLGSRLVPLLHCGLEFL